MDICYVSPFGDTLLLLNGKPARLLDLAKACKEAGISPAEYYSVLRTKVTQEDFLHLLNKHVPTSPRMRI